MVKNVTRSVRRVITTSLSISKPELMYHCFHLMILTPVARTVDVPRHSLWPSVISTTSQSDNWKANLSVLAHECLLLSYVELCGVAISSTMDLRIHTMMTALNTVNIIEHVDSWFAEEFDASDPNSMQRWCRCPNAATAVLFCSIFNTLAGSGHINAIME